MVMEGSPHFRFYCPKCDEVTCGMKRHDDWIVLPHWRNGKDTCLGGQVDGEKDRAP